MWLLMVNDLIDVGIIVATIKPVVSIEELQPST